MNLSDPTGAVTSSLDGPVLAVLAAAGRPLTVGQVAARAARGSEIGIRRALARLAGQGLVRATLMGRNQVHELNRSHVAAEAAVVLASLRTTMWDRMRTGIRAWRIVPLYACVFGSAARGDGDELSDIDVLLVRPLFPDEGHPAGKRTTADAIGAAARCHDADAGEHWERQLDSFRGDVFDWSGNQLQIVEMSFHQWRHPPKSSVPLLRDVQRDAIDLFRAKAMDLVGEPVSGPRG